MNWLCAQTFFDLMSYSVWFFSSLYFDDDDDLAHEFYIEVPSSKKGMKASMKRILHNLTPQGEVLHRFPRLHVDFPVILYQGDLLKH